MSKTKKVLIGIAAILVLMALAAVLVVPMLVDVDRYRPQVVAHLQESMGRPAAIGRLTLTLFPSLAIRVDNLELGNPPGFPQGDFVKAARIDALVDAHALWNRQIVITSLQLVEPEINLLATPQGHWNFETPSSSKPVRNASLVEAPTFSLGVIAKVTITDGHISASKLSGSQNHAPAFFDARGFSSTLEQVNLNAFSPAASGQLAPRPQKEIAVVPFWGPSVVHADSGAAEPAAQGTLKVASLAFQTLHAADVVSKLRLFPTELFLDDLHLHLYGGDATGDLQFVFAESVPRYALKAKMSGVDMARFLADVPGAQGMMTGKVQGNINLRGVVTQSPDPLAGMNGVGNVSVQKGNLPTLQLNKNLMELAKLSNLGAAQGDPGSFSLISADLNIASERITSKKITIAGNGVDAQGAGSMTLAGKGSLDYQGVATILAGNNQLNNIIANLAGGSISNGKLVLPFGIGGSLVAPKFIHSRPGASQIGNLANMIQGQGANGTSSTAGQTQSPANLVQGIAGLFKKKKN